MASVNNPQGIVVETAYGTQNLPSGMPSWVTPELVQQAAAAAAALANTPDTPARIIDGPNGSTYEIPGAPDWVNQSLLQQSGQILPPPPLPVEPPQPQGPNIPPPVGVPDSKTPPLPAGPVVAGQTGNPPAPAKPKTSGPSLPDAVAEAARIAREKARQAVDAVSGAVGDATDIAGRLLAFAEGVAQSLLPTISELALGLTSRFGDLAATLASKVVELPEYAATMASHAAEAMGVVLDDAWEWVLKALIRAFALLLTPVQAARDHLYSDLIEPAL